MGRVSVARDNRLGREVALKELAPHASSLPDAAERLAQEAKITAQLDHPNIVAVHDAGQLPDGTPFYTMRLVRGRTLAQAIAEAPDVAGRKPLLRHFLAACEALASAHHVGIVHRDLKPANILVGPFGETQVVDWGLACSVDSPGAAVGTPAYMSPEQRRAVPPSPSADVWSLGMILCELLCGKPDPSALHQPGLPSELVAIALHALANDPHDRYPNAAALTEDMVRWFEGRQVAAYTYTPWDLLRRVWRVWGRLLSVMGVALILVAVAAAVAWYRTQQARDLAEHNLALMQVEQALNALQQGERSKAELLAAAALSREDLPEARGILAAFGVSPRPQLTDSLAAPDCHWAQFSPSGAMFLCGQATSVALYDVPTMQLRWEQPITVTYGSFADDSPIVLYHDHHLFLLDQQDGHLLRQIADVLGDRSLSVSSHWALSSNPVWMEISDLDTGQRIPLSQCKNGIAATALYAEGTEMAALCRDGQFWHGAPLGEGQFFSTPLLNADEASALAFLPSKNMLAVGTLRGRLAQLDPQTGWLSSFSESGLGLIEQLRPSANGWVGVAGSAGGIGLWEASSGSWKGTLPEHGILSLSVQGQTLSSLGQRLRHWTLPSLRSPSRLVTDAGLSSASLSPNGKWAALARGDGKVQVIEIQTGYIVKMLELSNVVVKAAAWSPDSRFLAATSMQGHLLQVFDTQTWQALPEFKGAQANRRLLWAPDQSLIGANFGNKLIRWSQTEVQVLLEHTDVIDLAASPDAQQMVVLSAEGNIFIMDSVQPLHFKQLLCIKNAIAVDILGDGRLAVASADQIQLFQGDGRFLLHIPAEGTGLRDLAWSPDGLAVAGGGLDGHARVWSAMDGRLLADLAGHADRIVGVDYSPDGQSLLTASWDQSAWLWDLRVLQPPAAQLAETVRASWAP